ncbi:MAG: hypothetical protein F6K39_35660 [Okeania sp. SIO3B3]|nr:hypothetical protein [Okeania sp. SIO3B3]
MKIFLYYPLKRGGFKPQFFGKILFSDCLIEPFRNQPTLNEVRSCVLKLFSVQSELQREAKRNQEYIPELYLPNLSFGLKKAPSTRCLQLVWF